MRALTPTESRFIQDVAMHLDNGESLILAAPAPLRSAMLIEHHLWNLYWNSPERRNLAFSPKESVVPGKPWPEVVRDALRYPEPVTKSEELRIGLRNSPLYLLVRAEITPKSSAAELNAWLQQLHRYTQEFPAQGYPRSTLRTVVVLEETHSLPDAGPLRLMAWPHSPDSELEAVATASLLQMRETSRLPQSTLTYLNLRALDLAGGSLPDLTAALQKISESADTNDTIWLEQLDWSTKDTWVQEVMDRWKPFLTPSWRGLLEMLIDAGGTTVMRPARELSSLTKSLWSVGLWVEGGNGSGGWLTPAAMIGLRALLEGKVNEQLRVQIRYLLPAQDRAGRDLLARCLTVERQLKRRFCEQIEINRAALEDKVWNALRSDEYAWTRLLRRCGGVPPATAIDAVWELSLGEFLTLRELITGELMRPWEKLLGVRNGLAHGHSSNWGMYQTMLAYT